MKCQVRAGRAGIGTSVIAIVVVLVVVVAVAALYSASTAQPPSYSCPTTGGFNSSSGPIKIGYVSELSGSDEINGYAALIGTELAVNQTNASGGVDGRAIQLVVYNDTTNPSLAVEGACTLLQQDHVLAITGPTDQAEAIPLQTFSEVNGVPLVVSAVSSAALAPPNSNWTVSIQPDAVQWGAALAKYVSEVVPHAKIAIMEQNAEPQMEMAAGVRWFANNYRNESVVFDQLYANAQFPWATAAAAAKTSGANAVVVSWRLSSPGFSESNVIQALLSIGFNQSQIFVTSASNQVGEIGVGASGIRGATLFNGALAAGYPNASAFVSLLQPYVNYALNSSDYCGLCPTAIGPIYYYPYLGMKMMIGAMGKVLSSGQTLDRVSFMAAMKRSSIQDAFGNTLSIGPSGLALGTFYIVEDGQLNSTSSAYPLTLIKEIKFAPGSIPSYQISKTS
ncbi:MAG: ABC transporter substrate-binding protein [Nitrososphaerota archaeon]|nr:ABC transporter substrate-binding protein [Nitrososphaerota archaeon]MDG6981119.1 ABC transporter substrate-binding protein [Nitrososphaerota archaeon]